MIATDMACLHIHSFLHKLIHSKLTSCRLCPLSVIVISLSLLLYRWFSDECDMGDSNLSEFFEDNEIDDTDMAGAVSSEDLFSILETLDNASDFPPLSPLDERVFGSKGLEADGRLASSSSVQRRDSKTHEVEASPSTKSLKLTTTPSSEEVAQDGQKKMSHIAVERNRRKQMNEHLSVLRSIMPSFYVKRGDQASIVGGVVDYINELRQILQSLEAKKRRKVYSEVLSPRFVSSPRPSPLSPRKPPLSPRVCLPISPRTPQPSSPYKLGIQQGYLSPTISTPSHEPYSSSSPSSDNVKELVASAKSSIAEVEVKFSGPNVLLKTISAQIPGQALKIVAALEALSLEILNVSISTIDDTMLYSFTIKIGIECKLSAEELALEIQQTFC